MESGGVDPRVFDAIVNNIFAVLGPAVHQQGEWRNNLFELGEKSTTMEDRHMAACSMVLLGCWTSAAILLVWE